MEFPAFFSKVRTIRLYDPLAEFLGAAEGGIMEYGYPDVVRLAGHSCPTVAGAYVMTCRALRHLYGDQLPERGAIRVEFRDDAAAGVTGVIANAASLITGAAQDGGFKGLAGRYERRNLLVFNVPIPAQVRFTRLDTGAGCQASYQPQRVPGAPEMAPLMHKALAGLANGEELREFGRLWQERVRRILIDHFDDPEMVVVE